MPDALLLLAAAVVPITVLGEREVPQRYTRRSNGHNGTRSLIITGNEAPRFEYTFAIAMRLNIPRMSSEPRGLADCGGTLVASNVVVTAAHCVHNKKHKPFKPSTNIWISVHRHNIETSLELAAFDEHPRCSKDIRVKSWVNHPKYKPGQASGSTFPFEYDATVMILEEDVPCWDSDTELAELDEMKEEQSDNKKMQIGKLAHVIGWGARKYDSYTENGERYTQSYDQPWVLHDTRVVVERCPREIEDGDTVYRMDHPAILCATYKTNNKVHDACQVIFSVKNTLGRETQAARW